MGKRTSDKRTFQASTLCVGCGRKDWEHAGIECLCPTSEQLPETPQRASKERFIATVDSFMNLLILHPSNSNGIVRLRAEIINAFENCLAKCTNPFCTDVVTSDLSMETRKPHRSRQRRDAVENSDSRGGSLSP